MRLSVVMPNYNDGDNFIKLIPKIHSYLSNDDEIIFIDDGSTDDSYEKILNLVRDRKYKNVKIYRNDTNIGVVETENLGAKLAVGEFLYFAASDDDVRPKFFDVCVRELENNIEAGACSTGSYLEYPNGIRIKLPLRPPANNVQYISPEKCKLYFTKNENWISGNSCIYRRNLFNFEGGFKKELEGFCDVLFTILIPVKYGVIFVPEAMTIFRLSKTSYASKHYRVENINSTLKIIDIIKVILASECDSVLAKNWSERMRIQTIASVSVKESIYQFKKTNIRAVIKGLNLLINTGSTLILNKYFYIYVRKFFLIRLRYAEDYFIKFFLKQNKVEEWMI